MKSDLTSFFLSIPIILAVSDDTWSQPLHDPSFEEVLSLQNPGTPIISPDGRQVAFPVTQADWDENRYDTEIWLSKNGSSPLKLTNTLEGSSNSIRWSPDSKWVSFIADRGSKSQVFVIHLDGGEAQVITDHEEGINAYEWSPSGNQIAFLAARTDPGQKEKEEKYGKFEVEDEDFGYRNLYLLDLDLEDLWKSRLPEYEVDSLTKAAMKPKPLIDSGEYYINGFAWAPDGKKMAITRRPDPLINTFFEQDIWLIAVDDGTTRPLVENPSADAFLDWAPDSQNILFASHVDNRTSNYYQNDRYFRVKIDGTNQVELGADFDENISGLKWTQNGIYGSAWQKTERHLIMIDAISGKTQVASQGMRVFGFSIDNKAERIAFRGNDSKSISDIYLTDLKDFRPTRISMFNDQIKGWALPVSEVIAWPSSDGTTIEGVLLKPMDFDATKKYPLLVNIHGGPTGIDYPYPIESYVYPINQWINKGALVLMPNYRGSAGYGAEFRKLNVRNLGVGDAWDVMSGVDYLDQQGLIDTTRMGAMGWSQGGYISAFLTTNTNRFRAISVGAGISDWMTYYVNTDIHPFTRQYLQATPWEDPEIYAKTSPMTTINNASTPTLIQHGEFDRRVPIPNAYQLYQGLEDLGVETKLIVYKSFGHGITKPKERLAAVQHNWEWFNKYVWQEEVENRE